MKKLMFILAVAAVAVSANAASLKWRFSSSNSAVLDETPVANTTVYLLSDTTAANLVSAKTDIWTQLKADASYDITSSGKYVTSLATGSGGGIANTSITLDGTAGTKYYFAAVIVSGDYVYLGAPANNTGSDSLEKAISLNIGATAMNAMDASSSTTPGWYRFKTSSDIPEPTSGLLLLIGGSMLALRRRRA